jgi:hypothetical protein
VTDKVEYNTLQVPTAALLLQALDLVLKYDLAADKTLGTQAHRAGELVKWALQASNFSIE